MFNKQNKSQHRCNDDENILKVISLFIVVADGFLVYSLVMVNSFPSFIFILSCMMCAFASTTTIKSCGKFSVVKGDEKNQ